jgi:hypothetical protein
VRKLDPVWATIASEAGLPKEAEAFLSGETIAEVEESASRLVKLLGERAEQEAVVSQATNPIAASLGMKAQRQAALVQALHGGTVQERDEAGGFAGKTTGFDGGARETIPERRDPEREHGDLLGQMASISRTFGG